ncbi:hypothetical protein H5410_052350 [Solanum commersonii]|uniref:CCHC-type domain-containing protein n=1 Tax=Solanum commersonii TaxID=4109 RepID=A0A9J5X0V4_SOLCO|nr:hypothetical protein H5410_052350 [Solanum commersonii]
MKMWTISTTNPTVAPPEIKSMPRRPGKLRKKEAGETKKSGKLPRTGLAMTCSNCNGRGHNKRGCPQNVQSSAREEPSGLGNGRGNTSSSGRGRGKTSGLGRERGKPKNPSTEGEPQAKWGRGRLRKAPTAPPTPLTYPTLSAPPPPTATSLPTTSKRGRPIKTPPAHPAYLEHPSLLAPPTSLPTNNKKGRPRKIPPAHPAYLEHPAPPAPPTSLPTTSKRGRGRGSESAIHTKDHQSWEWPGMPSFKILSTGATKVTRSADITGDIGFKPSTANKLKWKGKSTISIRKLQEMSVQQRKKPKGSSSNNSSQSKEPWKM